ncbi:MAG TPA: hypothetical protein GX699_02410 [Firmicutes bacterium]|nr:hypothetical protein [Bacillota bacterium]
MKKFFLILLLILPALTGCAALELNNLPPQDAELDILEDDKVTRLADIDFVPVPGFPYSVLLEEGLTGGNKIFFRRFVAYGAAGDAVEEYVREAELPRTFTSAGEAREYLMKVTPEKLLLPENTYVSDNVHCSWEQEAYPAAVEEEQRISLVALKRLGAVSRLHEFYVIDKNPEALVAAIEEVEAGMADVAGSLVIERTLEPLPQSFAYSISLALPDRDRAKTEAESTQASVNLNYQTDELGNPLHLELVYSAVFQGRLTDGEMALLNRMGAFINELVDVLKERLDLFGVNKNNPSLAYANVTLYYEEEKLPDSLCKKIEVR